MNFSILFLCLVFSGVFHSGFALAANGVYPLNTVNVADPLDDLRPLDAMIRGAKLIGVGESVHGSAEYTKMETRLIRYLVERHKVRIIFWEGNIFRTEALRQYVLNGQGDLKTLLATLHHADKDVFNLVMWIRKWNVDHPRDLLRFEPIDVYVLPHLVQKELEQMASLMKNDYLIKTLSTTRGLCPGHGFASLEEWAAYVKKLQAGEVKITEETHVQCTNLLKGVNTEIAMREKEGIKALGRDGYYEARLRAHTIIARQVHMFNIWQKPIQWGPGWNGRDTGMSLNVMDRWTQLGLNKKAMFVGHTSHTSKAGSRADWWTFGVGTITSAGEYLRQAMGDNYKVIGFTGYHVTGYQGDWLDPVSPESLDKTLHEKGVKLALLDTKGRFVVSKDAWWVQNENAADAYPNGVFLRPYEHFDAMIYFDQSLKSDPMP